jgi:alpha-beta hydrolase superfamily lysophospholipase
VLAIVHGLAEHSARYDHVGRYFAARGYAVHAFDQRGHGESEGPRVYTPDFAHLLDDIERFLEHVRRVEGDKPLFLLGHSMGGLEVATLLATRQPGVQAAVLSGPALAAGDSISRVQQVMISVLSRVLPRLRLPNSIDPQGLSRDAEVVQRYMEDPLVDKTYTVRLIRELMAAMAAVEGKADSIDVPLLIVHGEADPVCPIAGSRSFAAERHELRSYADLRHEVLNEPEQDQVMSDIADWLAKQLPASA